MTFAGVSLRVGNRANLPNVRMILHAWFYHVDECFPYKEVLTCITAKSFAHLWKLSAALLLEMVMKPLLLMCYPSKQLS